MKFSNLYKLFLILFLVVGVIRFWKIPELGYFMMDEERDAFLVSRMLVGRRPLLIGGSIPGGINVGPMFFYLSAIPYALSNLSPIGPAYVAAAIGVIGVIGVFWVGKELFGRRVGLLAAVLAGFSVLNIIYQRPWWPLTMSQVVTLAVYLALFKLWKGPPLPRQGRTLINWLWVLVLALIVGAQSDPSTLSLIPLSIIWLWWYRNRIGLTRRNYLTAVCLFVLAHATWVVFEFRHDFQSSRAILGLFKGVSLADAKETPFWIGPIAVLKMTATMFYRLFFITGPLDVTKQISPAEIFHNQKLMGIWWPLAWIMLILVVSYALFNSGKRHPIDSHFPEKLSEGLTLPRQGQTLLSLHFLISLGGILGYTTMFPGYVHEWMWAFMFPGFFFMAGILLVKLIKLGKLVKFAITVVVLGWSVWQGSLFLKLDNVAGLGKKLIVVQAAQAEVSGRPYELRSEGEGEFRYGGWRYLFTLYGDPPVKSYMDYVYHDWLYPKSDVRPEVVVKVVSSARDKIRYEIKEKEKN